MKSRYGSSTLRNLSSTGTFEGLECVGFRDKAALVARNVVGVARNVWNCNLVLPVSHRCFPTVLVRRIDMGQNCSDTAASVGQKAQKPCHL